MAEARYEPKDVNVRTVVKAAVGLGALSLFGAAVSLGVFLLYGRIYRANDPAAAPLAPGPGRQPPMPRLQAAPPVDLEQLRAQQLQRLASYGWTDRASGAVHIPIEEAMKLYVQRAAGAAAAPAGAPASPSDAPGGNRQ